MTEYVEGKKRPPAKSIAEWENRQGDDLMEYLKTMMIGITEWSSERARDGFVRRALECAEKDWDLFNRAELQACYQFGLFVANIPVRPGKTSNYGDDLI